MRLNPTDERFKQYPMVVFCRKDFLKAIDACWDENTTDRGIDATKIKKYFSTDDIIENLAISGYARTENFLKEFGTTDLPFFKETEEIITSRMMVYSSVAQEQFAFEHYYGQVSNEDETVVLNNPVENQFAVKAKGEYLFVGIESGFIKRLQDKAVMAQFLTDCLEMCRSTMGASAIVSSSLYRRFIFTNVNV